MGSILEPGRPPKTDKAAILSDAVRMVTQLRSEAQKLKESNGDLQEKIKELKVRFGFSWLYKINLSFSVWRMNVFRKCCFINILVSIGYRKDLVFVIL